MFNNKKDNEADFCESYKSQILGTKEDEKENALFSTMIKLLTIFLLLSIIIVVSFYGYNYFMNNTRVNVSPIPPSSMQVSDDDLVVEDEDPEAQVELNENNNNSIPLTISPQMEELDINEMANEVKIAIAKSELQEENELKLKSVQKEVIEELNITKEIKEEKSLEIPTLSAESKYLEDLADLSKEIDKERNK